MQAPLPPEVTNPIIEIVSYALTFVLGIITKWLQGRKQKKDAN